MPLYEEPNGMAPTASIEVVLVGKPLKVMSLLCNVAALILLIVSAGSSSWMETPDYRTGLWEQCYQNATRFNLTCWAVPGDKVYSHACGAIMVISLLITFSCIIIFTIGMQLKKTSRKFLLYNIVLFLYIFTALFLFIPLIVYPVKFMEEMNQPLSKDGPVYAPWWNVGFAYIVGWVAVAFFGFAAILLYVDKNSEELVIREKVCMNGSMYSGAEIVEEEE